MIERGQVYKCEKCGNVLEVLDGGGPVILCCGDPMQYLEAKTDDAANEKHVPVIEKVDGGYKVKVGSVPHPMEEDHYIEWIELQCGDVVHKAFLKPGEAPEATFCCENPSSCDLSAREYCNKHGLWKA